MIPIVLLLINKFVADDPSTSIMEKYSNETMEPAYGELESESEGAVTKDYDPPVMDTIDNIDRIGDMIVDWVVELASVLTSLTGFIMFIREKRKVKVKNDITR